MAEEFSQECKQSVVAKSNQQTPPLAIHEESNLLDERPECCIHLSEDNHTNALITKKQKNISRSKKFICGNILSFVVIGVFLDVQWLWVLTKLNLTKSAVIKDGVSVSGVLSRNETNETDNIAGWKRPSVIYGHVHMAKTAGTEINGLLACHFERVCGNKGYSYDAFQHQEYVKKFKDSHSEEDVAFANIDSLSSIESEHNRGGVPLKFMHEIGYEDCDYISMEDHANFWKFPAARWKMELHVPCRDPLQHLMSMCNHINKVFKCDKDADDRALRSEIKKCIFMMGRFDDYFHNHPNITLKCFNPMPVSSYVSYMGKILQRKRVEADYIHKDTNKVRNKDTECIWGMDDEFQDRVRSILREKYSFFAFCHECMNSPDELKLD